MRDPRARRLLLAAASLLCVNPALAQEAGGVRADAEKEPFRAFSSTNLQLLQGYDFDDPLYFTGGRLTTVTLNHFSTWEHGDNFAFADFMGGRFRNGFDPAHPRTVDYQLYGEWHPRLFLNTLLGLGADGPLLGFVRNWGLAAELNAGYDFAAYLAGVGLDLAVPGFSVLGLNVYYRHDSVLAASDHGNQWQVSPYWTIDLRAGSVPVRFTGFVDLNGTWDFAADASYLEIWAQPEVLVDVLAPFGGKADRLWVGAEWFFHRHPVNTASVPQVMVQWTVY
jgi:nucleoside-specific outer membrane channel protein Tsx